MIKVELISWREEISASLRSTQSGPPDVITVLDNGGIYDFIRSEPWASFFVYLNGSVEIIKKQSCHERIFFRLIPMPTNLAPVRVVVCVLACVCVCA